MCQACSYQNAARAMCPWRVMKENSRISESSRHPRLFFSMCWMNAWAHCFGWWLDWKHRRLGAHWGQKLSSRFRDKKVMGQKMKIFPESFLPRFVNSYNSMKTLPIQFRYGLLEGLQCVQPWKKNRDSPLSQNGEKTTTKTKKTRKRLGTKSFMPESRLHFFASPLFCQDL